MSLIRSAASGRVAQSGRVAKSGRIAASGRQSIWSWSPANLPGLVLWLRADLGITIGTGVSAWADQSGNGNNFTQATGSAQPSLVTMSGRQAIRFTGASSQSLACVHTASAMLTGTSAERFAVMLALADPTVGPSDGGFEGLWTSSATASYAPFTDGNIYDGFASTVRKTMTGHPAGQCAVPFILDSYSAAGDFEGFFNGTNFFTTGVNTFGPSASQPTLGTGAGVFGNMTFGEYVVYNRNLTSNERLLVNRYLGRGWGIGTP
jgi:hypothetical protein